MVVFSLNQAAIKVKICLLYRIKALRSSTGVFGPSTKTFVSSFMEEMRHDNPPN